jgi:bifunctional DNase/RNase|tara:strand:+ start:197 stop:733 length:537 start_codon:yes stop_codon:yes gene_type:complete
MEELSIDSIRVSLSNYQRVVILKLKSKEMFIPIWVGPSEADAIAIKLQKVSLPRPLTHDLVVSLLESLSISIEYVLIESMKDETFFAKIAIKNNDKIVMIDSRASDAIALAVRVTCPIYANDDVVEKVSVTLDHKNETVNKKNKATNESNLSDVDNKTDISQFADFIDTLDLESLGDN